MMSTELQLALAPARTYRALIAGRTTAPWPAVLGPPAVSLLAIGVGVSVMAARRVTIELVATVAISWSFALLIQALAGAVLVLVSPRRVVSRPRAFELLFLGHVPWSLWIVAIGSFVLLSNPSFLIDIEQLMLTIPVPIAWTVVIVSAWCRTALGTTANGARVRVALHQAIIWTLALAYISFAAGGFARVVQVAGR